MKRKLTAALGAVTLAALCLTGCQHTETRTQEKYDLCVSSIQGTNGNDHAGAEKACADLKP